ncbi:hypothetical protein Tco_0089555 [Tanacetum coccineum]
MGNGVGLGEYRPPMGRPDKIYNGDQECDMPVTIPLPTTDVREENFDINLPLGEHVVDFLMENEDIADLPRHLVKQLFSYLVKHLSSTKTMSDEPLGDDSKPRSYDDISSLDPPKSAPLNYEPLGNPDSVSRSLDTVRFPYDREDIRACFQSSKHSVSDRSHGYIYRNFLS